METLFDINVDGNGNATVTQNNGAAVAETRLTFKASGPQGNGTAIRFDKGSPDFKVDGSGKVLKALEVQSVPCSLVPIEVPPILKVRHFDCGHIVNGVFTPWGAPPGVRRGGGLTPPIGGGNGA